VLPFKAGGATTVLLLVFIACINVSSFTELRIGLAVFSATLLVIGLRDIRLLMLALIALVPVQSAVLGFGPVFGFQLTFNRVAVSIAGVCYIAHRRKFAANGPRREALLYFLVGTLVLSVLSDTFGDGAFLAGAQRTLSESVEVLLFAYISYRAFRYADFATIASAFAYGGIVLCASTILERYAGINLLFRFPVAQDFTLNLQLALLTLNRGDVLRVRGSFQNPVYLSGFLPLLLFAAAYLLVINRRRVLGGTLLLLVLLTAGLSVSRTAMYGLAILGLPVLYMTEIKRGLGRMIKLAVFAAILAGCLYALLPADLERTVTLTMNPFEQSLGGADTADRINLISAGVPFVMELNPFGAGQQEGTLISALLSPDIANFFIGYGIERGVIWVMGFCVLLVYMMWRLARAGDMVSWMLFWLTASIVGTYFSYAEYWISFPMLMVFVLVHLKGQQPQLQQFALNAGCIATAG
jgi:hypothetical protein